MIMEDYKNRRISWFQKLVPKIAAFVRVFSWGLFTVSVWLYVLYQYKENFA